MPETYLYIVGGGISCGKSECIKEFDRRGHVTVPEAAKQIVDEGMGRGLSLEQIRGDEQEWQRKIVERSLLNEARITCADPEKPPFGDRGIFDGLGFLSIKKVAPGDYWEPVINSPQPRYRTYFSLDPLPEFTPDYFRREGEEAINDELTELTAKIYADLGIEVVHVPVMSVAERVDFMLAHVATHNAVAAA